MASQCSQFQLVGLQVDFPTTYQCEEPLRLAIKNDHYECAKLLLEHGADANAKYFFGPELAHVEDAHLVSADRPPGYPAPIVDHRRERAEALRRYRNLGQ